MRPPFVRREDAPRADEQSATNPVGFRFVVPDSQLSAASWSEPLELSVRRDGVPLPELSYFYPGEGGTIAPPTHRMRVAGNDDLNAFLIEGFTAFHTLDRVCRRWIGRPLTAAGAVIDWRIGCGRFARYLIDGGQGAAVLRRVRPRWQAYLAAVWEDIARRHAARLIEVRELPDLVVGRWWKDEQTEIDVVGLDADGVAGLIGEVKWQEHPFDLSQLEALRRRSTLLETTHTPMLAVWASNGVTDDVTRTPHVRSFTPADVFPRR